MNRMFYRFVLIICVVMGIFYFGQANAAAESLPSINFIGIDHSPLIEGDKETFHITSTGAERVQYRIFLYTQSTNKWLELTNGYTDGKNANIPFSYEYNKPFKAGKYKLSVWVRRENEKGVRLNSNGDYDNFYTANMSCVKASEADRVRADGDMDIAKDVYEVGEKIVVNGVKNIRGRKGPYTYRLHIFNPSEGKWKLDNSTYGKNIEWVPEKPGTYVLDLWGVSSNPVFASKLAKDPTGRLYDIWKLKVITVKKKEIVKPDPKPDNKPKDVFRICLDPGHGGTDSQNYGPTGYREAEGVLDIALKTRDILLHYPKIQVFMTRDTDVAVSLEERAAIINNLNADAAVSIHTNAAVASAHGAECFYSINSPYDELGYKLSRLILGELVDNTGVYNRGAKTKKSTIDSSKDYYYMIRETGPQTVIIECAFHTNPEEELLLKTQEYRYKCAYSIAKAIVEYCGLEWKETSYGESTNVEENTSENVAGDVLYKVYLNEAQQGAFRSNTNALNLALKLFDEITTGNIKIVSTNGEVFFDKTK